MHKTARRLMVVLAAAGAALAMSVGPAMAYPAPPTDGTNELSDTTKDAWDTWNEGACLVGEGAAQLVSGAYVGAPFIALDLLKGGEHLSDPSQLAWLTFNEGGGKLTQGAGQLISAAVIGVPYLALDYFKDSLDAAAPEDAEWKSWNQLDTKTQEFVGYECGYVF